MKRTLAAPLSLILFGVVGLSLTSWALGAAPQRGGGRGGEAQALAEPFVGVTTDGNPVGGLYRIETTGVSTAPVRAAAEAFLATLTEEQRAMTQYPVDDDEWRKWQNVHRYDRQGMSRRAMNDAQNQAAFGLLQASLSATGYRKARDIMTLNGVLADLVDNHEEYGEDLYFFTVMGEPSDTDPWGWQLDGHHLVINYFVLGDQVVMTPTFMGSEPVAAESGPHAGLRVFGPEETRGLAMIRALSPEQQAAAIVSQEPIGQVLTAAFRDNYELRYEGLRASEMDAVQRQTLLNLVREYVGNMDDGHAALRMAEIEEHLDDTWFVWMGGTGNDSVFYYRVHSPVVLLEFDHQGGIALNRGQGMSRNHVHTVIRTPNGNDYGKNLLRQHYEQYDHVNGVHVPRQR
ncbi:MAG: DUF3500 domain-containing protein [Acidobacteriota bacterium]|jgi:hypothetical protein